MYLSIPLIGRASRSRFLIDTCTHVIDVVGTSNLGKVECKNKMKRSVMLEKTHQYHLAPEHQAEHESMLQFRVSALVPGFTTANGKRKMGNRTIS